MLRQPSLKLFPSHPPHFTHTSSSPLSPVSRFTTSSHFHSRIKTPFHNQFYHSLLELNTCTGLSSQTLNCSWTQCARRFSVYFQFDDSRLRSRERCNFAVKRTPLNPADKVFSVAGPRAWNAVLKHICSSFRLGLLFRTLSLFYYFYHATFFIVVRRHWAPVRAPD